MASLPRRDSFLKGLSLVLLTLLYLLVWFPAGLLSRLLADWLRLRPPLGTNWQPRPDRVNRPETLREPF